MTDVVTLYEEHLRSVLAVAEETVSASAHDALLLHSGEPQAYFADDQEMPFRTNPAFAHVLPLAGPHHFLIIEPDRKPLLVETVPEDYWREHMRDQNEFWRKHFDIKKVRTVAEAWKEVDLDKKIVYIGNASEMARTRGISSEHVNPQAITTYLEWKRSFKTPYEVLCIEEANRRAEPGHRAAKHAFLEGASELQIHFAYLAANAMTEQELPYETVVALNEKSAILHYQGKRTNGGGKTFLLDAGASYLGYASDITRTYVRDDVDEVFSELLKGTERIQRELCGDAVPGVSFPDLHHRAHLKIGMLLQTLGIVKLPGEEAVAKGLTRVFLPHGLGHFLGIQVHDVGGNQKDAGGGIVPPPAEYPKLRMTRTIEKGMVFTIEPGVYFIELLLAAHRRGETAAYFNWEMIDRLMPYGGIRIEDDIVATESGNRNLTREVFS